MELIKKARTKMLQFYLQLLETEEELQKFTQLYETYRKLMHWTAEGILHDEYLAEDAVHEAFLRIIQNFHQIREIPCPKFTSSVVIIVRRKTSDYSAGRNPWRYYQSNDTFISAAIQQRKMG